MCDRVVARPTSRPARSAGLFYPSRPTAHPRALRCIARGPRSLRSLHCAREAYRGVSARSNRRVVAGLSPPPTTGSLPFIAVNRLIRRL
jgi:hypothetical protein